MKYITFSGLIVLVFFFIFSVVHYANSDGSSQKSLGEFWNGITGMAFFEDGSDLRENFIVTAAAFVLGVSIVYMLLRVVNGMIFAEKIS